MVWDGVLVGDASRAPYSAEEWDDVWEHMFGSDANNGVIPGWLEELEVTGAASPVTVHTGRAMVKGKWYETDADVTIAVPTPAGATRTDYVILRSDYTAQTIRAVLLQNGAEGTGTPPALTQTDGTMWEIPLAEIAITVGGVITVTDVRRYVLAEIWEECIGWPEFGVAANPAGPDAGTGGWRFDPGASEYVSTVKHIPGHVRGAANGGIQRQWLLWTIVSPGAGNVVWQLAYKFSEAGENFRTPPDSTVQVTATPSPAVADRLFVTEITATPAFTDKDVSLWIQVGRIGGNVADTYADDAKLLGLLIKWA